MKRKWKALASLCLALALMLCLSLPVWAEGDARLNASSTGTLTIDGLEEKDGVTVTAYLIMSVNWYNYAGTGALEDYEAPEDPTYKWDTSVWNWFKNKTNYSGYADKDGNVSETFLKLASDSSAIKDFYTDLAVEIRKEGSSIDIANPISLTLSDSENSYTATDDVPMGGYLVLVSGGTKIYSPVFVQVMPTYDQATSTWTMPDTTNPAHATVKQQNLTFKKEILKTSNEGTQTAVDLDTVAIGDTVTFRLTADVPKYLDNAIGKTFTISDTLPTGMTLDNASGMTVKGFIDTSYNYTGGTEITVTLQEPQATTGFALSFSYDDIKSYSYITVEYSVTMNSNTSVAPTGNQNTAKLEYTKDQLSGTTDTLQDDATVYSYGIIVTKKDEDTGATLSDAVFTLRAANGDGDFDNGGQDIKFEADANNSGTYRRAAIQNGSGVTELSVSDSGVLTLSGLDVGTYYLTEVEAPEGYNRLSAPIRVEITDNDDKDVAGGNGENQGPNGKPEYNTTDGEKESSDSYVRLDVVNTKGFTLPTTGGMGTVLFTAAGIALMGLGLAALVLYLRRRSDK